ncbi:MAG: putative blue pigment (indigoidine) exporter [Oceanospirillaceae bacterium]|jgi:probable blue pigment (indigoidine) exporter
MNYLIAMSVPILWGTSYAIIGLFLLEIPAPWLAVWRALPAGIILLMLKPKLCTLSKRDMLFISLGNIAIFFPLLITAIYLLPGSVAGTLGATFPLVMMLFNWIIYKVVPNGKYIVSSIIGLIGVMLLLNPTADVNIFGVIAAFSAISIMSITSIWMKRLVIDDVLNVAAWQLIIGGVLMLPFAYLAAGAFEMPDIKALPGLLWLVVLNTAYGYWAWVRSLQILGTQIMGVLSLLNPLIAVLLGVFIMSETLDNLQFTGIALIFGALLMLTPLRKLKFKKAP